MILLKQTVLALSAVALAASLTAPAAQAQSAAMQSQARTGSFGNSSKKTNNFRKPNSAFTRNQSLPRVRATGLGGLATIHGPTGRNGLPQTSLDSFVLNAGGSAEQIYGDEGTDLPPFFGFSAGHRIERGIQGSRAAGLTTGHGSTLPAAWGGDEFCKGSEFSRSGSSGGGSTWATPAQTGGNPGTRNPNQPSFDLDGVADPGFVNSNGALISTSSDDSGF